MSESAPAALVNDGLSAAVERARNSLVRVCTGGRGVGSGVAWAGEGIVVTNAHAGRRPCRRHRRAGRRRSAVG